MFGSEDTARTFDYRAGDVGYATLAMGHYIENTGAAGPMRFLEVFRSSVAFQGSWYERAERSRQSATPHLRPLRTVSALTP